MFWAKLSYSFMVQFSRILRDTKITGEQPIEEGYTVAAVAVFVLIVGCSLGFYNWGTSNLVWYGPVCFMGFVCML